MDWKKYDEQWTNDEEMFSGQLFGQTVVQIYVEMEVRREHKNGSNDKKKHWPCYL